MLKGLAITPPILGRISIGHIVEKNGKRLPEKDDQFTITTQVQTPDGWVRHPLDESLRATNKGKLRSIPIQLLFNDPDLNLRADYCVFNKEQGRPICVGNGETCRRIVDNQIKTLPCPSPATCEFGWKQCKPYARLNVVIDAADETGVFVFRTTSFNSIRTLAARMRYFHAVSGGLLACIPLELRLRGKSTTQSYRTPIYYTDLVLGFGRSVEQAIQGAQNLDARRREAGFDQDALDHAARLGFANGAFDESVEDFASITEEFFPTTEGNRTDSGGSSTPMSLTDKLTTKTQC